MTDPITVAVEALRPFAHYYELNDCKRVPDDDAIEVPVGDLRRASAALATLQHTGGQWFELTGDERLGRCTTENCGQQPIFRFEGGGVGSNYCSACRAKIEAQHTEAGGDEVGDWRTMDSAPKDGTQFLAWCRHDNWQYAKDDEERARWEGPVVAYWTTHNKGGWVWNGHVGKFIAWRPIPALATPTKQPAGKDVTEATT